MRRHSSGRFIRHRPPERACGLSKLCSTEGASSDAATRVRPTAAPSDAAALRASRCIPAVWERPAPPFRSARVVVGLCAIFLRAWRYAWPCTTLPNGLRHPGKTKGRSGWIGRRSLLPLFLIALGGLGGCGNSGPSPAAKQAEQEAHNIICGPNNYNANLIGGRQQEECEHPAEAKAERKEYEREHPALAKAQEEEEQSG